jgi:hypothetical protein
LHCDLKITGLQKSLTGTHSKETHKSLLTSYLLQRWKITKFNDKKSLPREAYARCWRYQAGKQVKHGIKNESRFLSISQWTGIEKITLRSQERLVFAAERILCI